MSNQGIGQPQTRSRRLVLHFGIGNTILMKDSSKEIKSVQLNVSLIPFTILTFHLYLGCTHYLQIRMG